MLSTSDRPGFRLRRLADRVGPFSAHGSFRPAIYEKLISTFRLWVVFQYIALFIAMSVLCQILISDQVRRQWVIGRFLQKQCKKILAFLKIQVIADGFFSGAEGFTQNSLILPNHISYLDVVVLNSLFPARYVTSRDIETTPFLGFLCRYAGCLFVNRFAKKDLLRDINDIARHLNTKGATPFVLFPEGTTSNGLEVLGYKKSLIQAALQSRCKVIPLCLRYTEVDGKPFDASCHERLAWYGPMKFFPHLWQLMSLKSAKVEVFCGSPMVFRDQKCRKKLADGARSQTERLFYHKCRKTPLFMAGIKG